MSEVRELTDTLRKGADPEASAADREANRIGREGATAMPESSCVMVCDSLIPNGLPEKYTDGSKKEGPQILFRRGLSHEGQSKSDYGDYLYIDLYVTLGVHVGY